MKTKSLPTLIRPSEFQRLRPDIFESYGALRYHLDRRHKNGMVETGAVVETAIGLRINPDRFHGWLLRSAQSSRPDGVKG